MGRIIGWLRGLPLWGKVVLAMLVLGGVVAPFTSPPAKKTEVAAVATTTTRKVTTTSSGPTSTTRRSTTTTAQVTTTKKPTTTTGKKAVSATTIKENARCQAVPQPTIAWIANGLTVTGGGSLRFVRAVKSKDFNSIYFVTADLQGSGLEGKSDLATWVVNRLDGDSRVTYSVDAVAKEFSDWGDGGKTDSHFSMSDDGAQESQGCTKAIAKAS